MAVLDIILLVCFIPGIVNGISKGFVKQVVDLVAIFAGAWAAFRFSESVSKWLESYLTMDPKLLYVISFAIVIVLAVLILNLVGGLVLKIFKMAALGWLNRIAGLALGILKADLILGIMISVFEGLNAKWNLVGPEKLQDAVVYDALKDFAAKVLPFLKNLVSGAPAVATGGAVTNV